MDFATFKLVVAGYMQRDPAVFSGGGVDLLGLAINQAQMWAQRKRNFELSRVQVSFPSVHFQNGALISTAVDNDTAEPVNVKVILAAFLPFSDGSGYFPISIATRDAHLRRLQKNFENWVATDPTAKYTPLPLSTGFFWCIRLADKIYVAPSDETALGGQTVNVRADVIQWLPELRDADSSNFLLEYCHDFMLYRSIYQLNHMLKEDQRVPVTKEALQDGWQSVIEWDSSITLNSAEDTTLD